MLPVRTVTTKPCGYGVFKSDTRDKSVRTNTYYFINFPKPCLQYRKKIIKRSDKEHIEVCSKCRKCELWMKKCDRSDKGFQSIDHVTKDTYICLLHFYGESGATEEHPDPLSPQEFHIIDKTIHKVVTARTTLSEKYTKVDTEEANGPSTTKINNIKTIEQTSMSHQEDRHIVDDNFFTSTTNSSGT